MFRSIFFRKYLTKNSNKLSDHGQYCNFKIGQPQVTTRNYVSKDDITPERPGSLSKLQRQLSILEKKRELMNKMSQMLTDQEQALLEKLKESTKKATKGSEDKPKSSKNK